MIRFILLLGVTLSGACRPTPPEHGKPQFSALTPFPLEKPRQFPVTRKETLGNFARPEPRTPTPVVLSPPTPKKPEEPKRILPPTPVPEYKKVPPGLVATFEKLIGLRESPVGSNRGPLIDQFNSGAGASLGSPWCAAVADWGYKKNGLKGRGAYSPSWFSQDRVVPRDRAVPGDMCLIWFKKKGRYAHTVAVIRRVLEDDFETLEGNTNKQGSREGDGFYIRLRDKDSVTVVRWWKNPA